MNAGGRSATYTAVDDGNTYTLNPDASYDVKYNDAKLSTTKGDEANSEQGGNIVVAANATLDKLITLDEVGSNLNKIDVNPVIEKIAPVVSIVDASNEVASGLDKNNKMSLSDRIYNTIEGSSTLAITFGVAAGILCPEAAFVWAAEMIVAHAVLNKK